MSLSDKQRDDLHKAMLDYLYSAGYKSAYEAFKQDLPNFTTHNPDPDAQTNGILVKKWTSIIRMQRKIMDLDARLQQALEEQANAPVGAAARKYKEDWIPTANARHILSGHRARVQALAFHPRYSVIVTGSEDATLKVWDWETGELERTLKGHTKHVTNCDFDAKGARLASSSHDMFIKLWNVDEEYSNTATLRGHEHAVSSVKFMPNDTHVVSASWDQTIRIWEIATTHCVKVIRAHNDYINGAVPTPDGRFLLTWSKDQTACIVDADSGMQKSEMRGHDHVVEVAALAPPNAIDCIKDLVSFTPPTGLDASKLSTLAVSFVATASRDKTIKLWDALRGRCLWTFVGHDGWVEALVFHPSGKYLLSAGDDHTIRVWDLKTGRCVRKIDAHAQFVCSMAWGRQPSTSTGDEKDGGGSGVAVGKVGGSKGKDGVVQAAVMPMNVLATGSFDKTVKIWTP